MRLDRVEAGTYTSFADRIRNKYTEEQIKELVQKAGRANGKKFKVASGVTVQSES